MHTLPQAASSSKSPLAFGNSIMLNPLILTGIPIGSEKLAQVSAHGTFITLSSLRREPSEKNVANVGGKKCKLS